ncbi:hypothetical protein [Streptomyces sp. NBC_00620]|uniref:hypothetical protein n=1 Tax=Streptomyces sp. NBC_00620 TaxID=2903666 RepID=UPI002250795D|nr:hypothetical protein [Streptomyces sp. NBC_00620]MCX4974262.1 hypothetical protein [Streptomyces sp. NBC_00620]
MSAPTAESVPDEDHPTGTAWRTPQVHRTMPALPPRYEPCVPEEQARHRAALCAGIAGYVVGRPLSRPAHQEQHVMPIRKRTQPVYSLVCSTDTCEAVASHDDGMPWYFESRDAAASWAHDHEWEGPWILNDGAPAYCPDCARERAEQKAREESDQEHHQAEINAAITYALEGVQL